MWSDFGNVFLKEEDPLRSGGKFEWENFIQKMIVTGGIGIRIDVDYLVLRGDLGVLLYYPWGPSGDRWIWQNGEVIMGATIGIGYPF